MSKPEITIDVVSDVVCPWCYLGKRRLERAIALVPELDVTVRWRPFQLDPSVPPEGMDRREYFRRKFGSPDAVADAHRRLTEFGRAEGIEYRFDDMTRAANTIDAHRVIRWAAAEGKEEAMVERLFHANFTDALDIGDRQTLARLAGELGMDADMVAARLATDEDRAAVEAEIGEAQRIGVTGVPTFIVDRRYAVVGAHPAESIAGAIRQAAETEAAAE
jgi:predicted DsbA family dithiol-disulfide isomerase